MYEKKSSRQLKSNGEAVASLKGKNGAIELKDNRESTSAQLKKQSVNDGETIQQKPNNTGLPNQLKSGIENLSGHSMDDVKVHYNSSKPAQLNAHAYAQGTDIHVASGQEKHLAHEAWHVVQQKQGRVKPTKQLKSKVNVNDDPALEKEADVMGAKAMQFKSANSSSSHLYQLKSTQNQNGEIVQRLIIAVEEIADKRKIIARSASDYKESDQDFDHEISSHEPGEINEKELPILGVDEPLIVIGHGQPVGYGIQANEFAGYTAVNLATLVAGILPKGYQGEIFLNGCYTAQKSEGYGFLAKAGISYIDHFSAKLKSLRKDVHSYVRGNKGASITVKTKEFAAKSETGLKNRFASSTISKAQEVNVIGGKYVADESIGQSSSVGGKDMNSKKNK
jgi:hypothetical protein